MKLFLVGSIFSFLLSPVLGAPAESSVVGGLEVIERTFPFAAEDCRRENRIDGVGPGVSGTGFLISDDSANIFCSARFEAPERDHTALAPLTVLHQPQGFRPGVAIVRGNRIMENQRVGAQNSIDCWADFRIGENGYSLEVWLANARGNHTGFRGVDVGPAQELLQRCYTQFARTIVNEPNRRKIRLIALRRAR